MQIYSFCDKLYCDRNFLLSYIIKSHDGDWKCLYARYSTKLHSLTKAQSGSIGISSNEGWLVMTEYKYSRRKGVPGSPAYMVLCNACECWKDVISAISTSTELREVFVCYC